MNVSYINPFINAARHVVDTMVRMPLVIGKASVRPPGAEPISRTFKIAVLLRISGAVHGMSIFRFSEPTALAMASSLAGTTFEELCADAQDALAELAT